MTDKRTVHTNLVLRMADAQGFDLLEMIQRGSFEPGDLTNAVDKCIGCTNPGACACLLGDAGPAQIDLPSYCRNEDMFERLGKQ